MRNKIKVISDEWLNNASEKEISRIIIHFNDGQGDIASYTMIEARKLLSESVDSMGNPYDMNMSNSELIDNFYNDLCLNGNETRAVYFDDVEGYLVIDWRN